MLLLLSILLVLLAISIYKPIAGLIVILVCYPTLSMLSVQVNVVLIGLCFVLIGVLLKKNYKSNLEPQKFPFTFAFAICALSYFLTFMFANDFSGPSVIINRSREYVLAFLLWKMFINTKSNHKLLIRSMMIYTSFLAVYGIIESFTSTNPFIDYLYESNLIGRLQSEDYIRYGLYRAQSVTIWCSAFGIASCMGFVMIGHYYCSRTLKLLLYTPLFVVFGVLCVLAVICCGTRSVYIVTVITSLSFLPYFKLKTLKFAMPLILVVIIASNLYGDFFQTIFDSMVNYNDSGGSSLELRQLQWITVVRTTNKYFWLGRGLGSVSDTAMIYDSLRGAESIIFTTMLERGALGLLSTAILYVSIIVWFIRRSQYKLAIITVAFVVGKVMSLLPGNGECYILLIVIPLYKYFEGYDKISQKSIMLLLKYYKRR